MAYPAQATPAAVIAAGLVRLAGLASKFLYLDDNHQPTDEVASVGIDLRQKLEALALTADKAEVLAFLADLGETYDLPEGVYTDPLLRGVLPPVPANGAEVRPFALGIQGGKVLTIQGGKALGLTYRLVPSLTPVVVQPTQPTTPSTPSAPVVNTPVATPYERTFTNVSQVQVQHYLGRLALFQLFDQQGQEFEGAVDSSDIQQITIVFSQPISGTIVLY